MQRRAIVIGLAASFITSCLAGGCATYGPPSIEVLGGSLTERTDEAVRLDLEMELSNSNLEPLELRWFTYTVSIDGEPVYIGKRAAEATLASASTKRLQLPAVIRFDRVGWDAAAIPPEAAWSINGSLLYISPGEIAEILLDTGVRKPQVAFTGSGLVNLDAR